MLRSGILTLMLAVAACCAAAAEPSGTITILEGDALVYRGAVRLQAQEGLRIVAGDIVETAAGGFAQIEMPELSKIELGPATRLQFMAPGVRGKGGRSLYFLQGWGKLTNAKAETGFELRAPLLEIAPQAGVIVFDTAPAEVSLFVEHGDIRLAERAPGAGPAPLQLRSGDYYKRKAGMRGYVNPPEAEKMIERIPRPFRDTLPSRLAKFHGVEVKPREMPDFGYADVEPWLNAEPVIRRQFVHRWRSKAREAAFRSALVAHLSSHPEWDPILFPEKYLPKEQAKSPTVAGGQAAVPVR